MKQCKNFFCRIIAIMLALFCVFSFSGSALAASSDSLKGDIDGNGVVDLNDAVYLLLHVMFGEDNYPLEDKEETTPTDPAVKVMTYAEFMAAELYTPVVVESYIQATQGWWDNAIVAYTQNEEGAYFVYKFACSEEEAAKLVPGTKVRITGSKGMYMDEIEIMDATFEILEGNWIATALDVTALLGTEELINHQNKLVAFKGMTVRTIKDTDGNEKAFLYSWDGSGEAGSDLYFNASINGATYTFCVESYLTGADTEVYTAVEALQVGDVIDMEGFLYWFGGMNPHITSVTPAN